MPWSARLFAVILLTFLVLAGPARMLLADAPVAAVARQTWFTGGPLLELKAPDEAGYRQLGAVAVLVRFPREDRIALETFRVLLNGQDVTDQLTVGQNGAGGSVYPLLEGPNLLRVEVFGRGWWTTRYFQDAVERQLVARPPIAFDRA